MSGASPTLVWLRNDLRLGDNPALGAGIARGPIVPVYVWSPEDETPWAPGAASRWWLHRSLQALDRDLRARGSRLTIRRGPARRELLRLVTETGARGVVWSRRYEPAAVACERSVASALREHGLAVQTVNASLLHEPWELATRSGRPFQVFTPFARACLERPGPTRSLPPPAAIAAPASFPASLRVEDLGLEPTVDWAAGLRAAWQPGEVGALAALERFGGEALAAYGGRRDRPDLATTSRLSPHIHFGEIGPRQLWTALVARTGAEPYLRQVLWREFAHHLLYHFPETPEAPLRPAYARFPWEDDPGALEAWRRARTGYPIVDAGMRQLWAEGWIPNRVRMLVASFLVKDLLVPWQEGSRWFWDTLVDADLADNTLGWQWIAGSGADASPYFRIFNPTSQGERFDPEGAYVRRYLPELAGLPREWIHRPWAAPRSALVEAGVELGRTYPHPIVDHGEARRRALTALSAMRAS